MSYLEAILTLFHACFFRFTWTFNITKEIRLLRATKKKKSGLFFGCAFAGVISSKLRILLTIECFQVKSCLFCSYRYHCENSKHRTVPLTVLIRLKWETKAQECSRKKETYESRAVPIHTHTRVGGIKPQQFSRRLKIDFGARFFLFSATNGVETHTQHKTRSTKNISIPF